MFFAPVAAVMAALGPRITGQAIGVNAGNPREWGDLDSFLEEVASDGMRFEGDFDAYDAR